MQVALHIRINDLDSLCVICDLFLEDGFPLWNGEHFLLVYPLYTVIFNINMYFMKPY
jgi:hypothetical protein